MVEPNQSRIALEPQQLPNGFYTVFENSLRQEFHNFKAKLNIILATICIPLKELQAEGDRPFLHNIHTFITNI